MKAIRIIEDEHRSITAVLEGLRQLAAEADAGATAPDFELMAAMLRYIEAFPERLHHPKEDDFLFARLRARRPDAAPLLERLSREHEQGRAHFAELKAAFERYRQDPAARRDFADRIERYAELHWRHMRREEDEVLPLALQALAPDDWEAIDAAFASNDDPVVGIGATREFRRLFRQIALRAPPPLGVGPPAADAK
ncbi:MAG: hemerythrin domain-containing protein [Burkholderiaceae bacterium]|nr:hemerythrin domain-containing protein [Burkholderiaceae bacterium]